VTILRGWGFSSAVEHLPSKRKALGSVPSSEKKKEKKKSDHIASLNSTECYPKLTMCTTIP